MILANGLGGKGGFQRLFDFFGDSFLEVEFAEIDLMLGQFGRRLLRSGRGFLAPSANSPADAAAADVLQQLPLNGNEEKIGAWDEKRGHCE